MDNPIIHLEESTQSMVERLSNAEYEEIEAFVNHRESLLSQMSDFFETNPMSTQDKESIRLIIKHDEQIYSRMIELKSEAADWLAQRNSAKSRRSAYESAYSTDSFLMDRKK